MQLVTRHQKHTSYWYITFKSCLPCEIWLLIISLSKFSSRLAWIIICLHLCFTKFEFSKNRENKLKLRVDTISVWLYRIVNKHMWTMQYIYFHKYSMVHILIKPDIALVCMMFIFCTFTLSIWWPSHANTKKSFLLVTNILFHVTYYI